MRNVILHVEEFESRDAPSATLVGNSFSLPGTARGFDPQPDPPADHVARGRVGRFPSSWSHWRI